MMFRRIVVPLDGSPLAERALPIAAHMARVSGASIHLLRVVMTIADFRWDYIEPTLAYPEVLEAQRREAEEYLKRMGAARELKGCRVTTSVEAGNPSHMILSSVQDPSSDLIVLSSYGATGMQRWVLGSVARKIAYHSPVPVLILREEGSPQPPLSQKLGKQVRVLLPLDGSPLAEEALVPAVHLAQALSSPTRGSIHLANVLPQDELDAVSTEEQEKILKIAQGYLKKATERAQSEGRANGKLTVTSLVTFHEDTATALVELAETGKGGEKVEGFAGCDVVALATHGYGAFKRWMLGSVTERVLDATRLPLLIVRPEKMQ